MVEAEKLAIPFAVSLVLAESASPSLLARERYREAYENCYPPFAGAHGYISENYLVNRVFRNLFPFD